ncbi:MFS transporter [Achromobacter xylosoxidans]
MTATRKRVLAATLILMGSATALIGLLPSYAVLGVWAPVLLVGLRVLQGFSAGGEWGGAALMAVEHAPAHRRSLFGAFPQIGVPMGMIVATGVLWCLTTAIGMERFMDWGWRVPFLLSVLLIVVGTFIRRAVEESPVFLEMQARKRASAAPLGQLLRRHPREVLLTALIFVGNSAAGYLLVGFFISYGSRALKMPAQQVLMACTLAAGVWLATTLLGGWLGDRIGGCARSRSAMCCWRCGPCRCGASSTPPTSGNSRAALVILALPLGLTYGPQAALYAEMFPAGVRYSGISVGYALGSILGGAFAAMIAQWIISATGKSWMVGVYVIAMALVSLVAVSLVRERAGATLHAE